MGVKEPQPGNCEEKQLEPKTIGLGHGVEHFRPWIHLDSPVCVFDSDSLLLLWQYFRLERHARIH